MTIQHYNHIVLLGQVLPGSVERGLSSSGNPVLKFRMQMRDKPFKNSNGEIMQDITEVSVRCYRKPDEIQMGGGDMVMVAGRLVVRKQTFVIAKHVSVFVVGGVEDIYANADNIGNLLSE